MTERRRLLSYSRETKRQRARQSLSEAWSFFGLRWLWLGSAKRKKERGTRGDGAPALESHENRYYSLSESAEISSWLRGSRVDKCSRKHEVVCWTRQWKSYITPLNGIIEVEILGVTLIWFNGTVQTVFIKQRFDVKYALAEAASDKRFVESLKWRSEKYSLLKKNLAACIVDGTRIIKAWTGLLKCNTYHAGARIWKTFHCCYYLLKGHLTSDVFVSLLQPMKTSRYSLCSKV